VVAKSEKGYRGVASAEIFSWDDLRLKNWTVRFNLTVVGKYKHKFCDGRNCLLLLKQNYLRVIGHFKVKKCKKSSSEHTD
jgi:hypothetical protein